ncbi:TRAP transporter small permease [Algihabitans albus]|uniref:TRAP transporter small permease n=1 Tax=Algihabitans albus TaxID=2164067 RepID=UPI000E5CD5ED|nr:TRAP transporter small permease [Algihabitans albus]
MTRLLAIVLRAPLLIAGVGACLSLAAIMTIMVTDVIGRHLLNAPVPGAAELIELLMALLVFSALPLTTLRREHIQVDLFTSLVPIRARRITEALANAVAAVIVTFITWRLYDKTVEIVGYGDTTAFLRLPLAPVAGVMTAMAGLTAIAFFVNSARDLRPKATGPKAPPPPGEPRP